jgi:hypothetical protein
VRRFTSNSQFLRLGWSIGGGVGGLGAVGKGPLGVGRLDTGKPALVRGIVVCLMVKIVHVTRYATTLYALTGFGRL